MEFFSIVNMEISYSNIFSFHYSADLLIVNLFSFSFLYPDAIKNIFQIVKSASAYLRKNLISALRWKDLNSFRWFIFMLLLYD